MIGRTVVVHLATSLSSFCIPGSTGCIYIAILHLYNSDTLRKIFLLYLFVYSLKIFQVSRR